MYTLQNTQGIGERVTVFMFSVGPQFWALPHNPSWMADMLQENPAHPRIEVGDPPTLITLNDTLNWVTNKWLSSKWPVTGRKNRASDWGHHWGQRPQKMIRVWEPAPAQPPVGLSPSFPVLLSLFSPYPSVPLLWRTEQWLTENYLFFLIKVFFFSEWKLSLAHCSKSGKYQNKQKGITGNILTHLLETICGSKFSSSSAVQRHLQRPWLGWEREWRT